HDPCQILADIYTFIEHRGPIQGKTVAWIGDSNNMCNTWLQAAEILDFRLNVSTPPGYEVEPQRANGNYRAFRDPLAAAKGAHLVTTDVWTSMGFEAEDKKRRRAFRDWQVGAEMMHAARKDAVFMHCLPAHRGARVQGEVGSERVLDLAERALADAAVLRHRDLLVRGLDLDLGFERTAGEYRREQRQADAEDRIRMVCQHEEVTRDAGAARGERDFRQARRLGFLDAVERGSDAALCGDHVGPALEQRGGHARGNGRRLDRQLRGRLERGGRIAAGERLQRAQRLLVG